MDPRQIVSPELASHLTSVSRDLGRQVGVLLRRDGSIRNVIVGDAHGLEIPEIGRLRGRLGRLRGLRLIHTHLAGEDLSDDDLNDLALLRLDMIAMVEVGSDGMPGKLQAAHVIPLRTEGDSEPFEFIASPNVHDLDFDFGATIRSLEQEFAQVIERRHSQSASERALVIGVIPDDDHFDETLELVRSADIEVAGTVRQPRRSPHPKTVVGAGKLREIVLEGMRRQAEVAIFDVNLKPAQARAFEDATGLKAIDWTQLILDIFAQRAKSRDGKLQVELAQLKYSLPRLTEKDAGLSRLAGGIGGRGPGETVLEIGRRRINDRIRSLEKQVRQLSKQRDLRRTRREKNRMPVLSIIGYTNAGKTTLLNALTKSSVEAEDKLFVTLDPTTRRLRFPQEGEVIVTDTVGFMKDLPADLVDAFRATIEELTGADLLLHVVDASDSRLDVKMGAVTKLLDEMGLASIPRLLVLNKSDLLSPEELEPLATRLQGIPVSAVKRLGLRLLIEEAEEMMREGSRIELGS